VFYLSPKWKQMLGYEDDELANVRASFERLLHPDERATVLALIDAFLAGKVAQRGPHPTGPPQTPPSP
jgi:hypothetical protein